jgi:tetratricopeptide (TPR) repeat protein
MPIQFSNIVRCASFWIALIAVQLVFPLYAADQVTRRSDRATFRGELTGMTTTALTIKLANGENQEIPVSDIFGIRFDMEPPTLTQGQSNERSGSLDSALEKYKQVQSEYAGDDKRLIADLKFLIARTMVKSALANPAMAADAQKSINAFRTENKANFRYLEATLLEAQLLSLDAANAAAVEALLKEVQAAPVKGFQLQAGVQLGRLLLSGNNADGAIAAFDQVITQSAGDAGATSAMFDGMLGKAQCQQKQGQIDEAVASLNEVISKASESETQTLAAAWILKGDCLRTKNLPKDALWAYLHVDVLYPSEPAAHAEALFRLAALWAPAGHPDRADEAMARLTSKYPNSAWARQTPSAAP